MRLPFLAALLLLLAAASCSAPLQNQPAPADDASAPPAAPTSSASQPLSESPQPSPDARPPSGPASSELECSSSEDCPESQVCVGPAGCDSKWICVPGPLRCTRNLVIYCGCDGKTFRASGNCPMRKYSARGPCGAGESPEAR